MNEKKHGRNVPKGFDFVTNELITVEPSNKHFDSYKEITRERYAHRLKVSIRKIRVVYPAETIYGEEIPNMWAIYKKKHWKFYDK